MDTVLRAVSIYVILLLVLRFSGRRTLGQMTAFDFVLLLVIGEATQQALLGDDFSVTTATIAIVTLVLSDIALAFVKDRFNNLDIVLDGQPLVLVEHGKPLQERLKKARISTEDILQSARKTQGLTSIEEIKYAVLETDGQISIIPAKS